MHNWVSATTWACWNYFPTSYKLWETLVREPQHFGRYEGDFWARLIQSTIVEQSTYELKFSLISKRRGVKCGKLSHQFCVMLTKLIRSKVWGELFVWLLHTHRKSSQNCWLNKNAIECRAAINICQPDHRLGSVPNRKKSTREWIARAH